MVPGLALDSATSSAIVLAGTPGLTATTLAALAIEATGAKSF
jgi:hypothetical protein